MKKKVTYEWTTGDLTPRLRSVNQRGVSLTRLVVHDRAEVNKRLDGIQDVVAQKLCA